MSAESTATQIINAAQSLASSSQQAALGYSSAAQTAASTMLHLGSIPPTYWPEVEIPPFNPKEDLAAEFVKNYNAALTDFNPYARAAITDFVNRWFPDFEGCVRSSSDTWICNTINNGGTGIPAVVENQIYERERARVYAEANRAKMEAMNFYASRGFNVPAGVLTQQLQHIDDNASMEVSKASREVAIKNVEIEIENIRFAVGQAVQLRLGAIAALVSYVRAWLTVPELAIAKAKALSDAKATLWQSSSAYYTALIAAQQLLLKASEVDVNAAVQEHKIVADYTVGALNGRVTAAVTAAKVMGDVAAAALSAQNSLAHVGATEQTVKGG